MCNRFNINIVAKHKNGKIIYKCKYKRNLEAISINSNIKKFLNIVKKVYDHFFLQPVLLLEYRSDTEFIPWVLVKS